MPHPPLQVPRSPCSTTATDRDLLACAREAKTWLFEAALPLWSQAGFNRATGLFEEALDLRGRPTSAPSRLRVQARQTYVFMQAGRLGWPGPWRAMAEAGLTTLLERGRVGGGAVGNLFAPSGALVDPRRDLYNQAFALFGLAHARPLAPSRVDERIAEILDYLASQRETWGGFHEGEVSPAPRRQNPHMHLLEAALALMDAEAPGGEALVEETAPLFERVFYDPAFGVVREYYDNALAPAPGELGRVCEPGHHCEWIWLLDRLEKRTGRHYGDPAQRLWRHALSHGHVSNLLVDETWCEGGVKSATARLWPQTEWLKAALVRLEQAPADDRRADVLAAYAGLAQYLCGMSDGLWRDRRGADGRFVQEPVPASSFYHIMVAVSELDRVAGHA